MSVTANHREGADVNRLVTVTGAFIDRMNKPLVLGVFLGGEPSENRLATVGHEVAGLGLSPKATTLLEALFGENLISEAQLAKHMNGIGMIRLVPNGQGNDADLALYIAEIVDQTGRVAGMTVQAEETTTDADLKRILVEAFEKVLND